MSEFIPPYPPRLSKPPSNLRRLTIGRQNFLAMWEEDAFEVEFAPSRMFLRRTFLCNSPESVQFALNLKNTSFERKSPQMRYALAPLLGDGLFVSDGETWRRRRKIVAPIIHTSRLPEFAPVITETALEVREKWAGLEGQAIDILAWSAHFAAETICRTLFGRELGHDHAHAIVAGFSDYQAKIGQIDLPSFFGVPDWVPRWQGPVVRRSVARIHAILDEVIANARLRSGKGEASLIGALLDAKDEDTGLPLAAEALRNEAAVLFMAGHETTANSLAWAWYLLSQAPEVEAKLHAEIDQVLGGRPPSLADVPHLPYVRAVIDETLRLYPPVPILPREAVAAESFQDTPIPKGSLVFVVPWLLHRHKKLWDRPDHFIPERFLTENAKSFSKYAYIPFSTGPRVCAGMSFGLTEMILCIATLAQKFRLRLEPGYEVKPVCRLTLRPEGGIPMRIEARDITPSLMPRDSAPLMQAAGCPIRHA